MRGGDAVSSRESGAVDEPGLTIDDVLIISCDRYAPWDGSNVAGPDHIWADLPLITGVKMLVYCEHSPSVSAGTYAFGSAEYLTAELSATDRLRVLRDAVRDTVMSLTIDRRLALGLGPSYVARFWWRTLRRSKLSPYLCRFQVARLVISRELKRRKPSVALFHGEFGPWGLAVAEACRRAGVRPVGVQHGSISRSSPVYQSLEKLGDRLADGLLCVSSREVEKWDGLPISVALLGSRRVRWNLPDPSSARERGLERMKQRILIVPPSLDSKKFRAAVLDHPKIPVDVKPHPLHRDNWAADHVQVVDGELNDLLPCYEVVVTGSPHAQIALAMLDKPYIRIRSSDSADWESKPGCVTFDSLDEVLSRASDSDWLRSVCAWHMPDPLIPPDVSADGLLSAVKGVLGWNN